MISKGSYMIRQWCKSCNEFTVQDMMTFFPEKETSLCKTCKNTVNLDEIDLSEIPEEKILQQRERYKKYRSGQVSRIYNTYIKETAEDRKVKELIRMFSPPGTPEQDERNIAETDAGLQKLMEAERAERDRIKMEQKAQILKYSKVGRNEACICGSGLKYKKCCQQRIESYK